ncbi:hypothetical protein GGF44_003156 [Coemansia sp. RSA 1694]|nr:hypothetical protein GGF44_003156 [Coemansia sp. RSA 1694]
MVNLELDLRAPKRNLWPSIIISAARVALQFSLGIASSYALYYILKSVGGESVSFLLLCSVAMAITVFPILASSSAKRDLLKTTTGSDVGETAVVLLMPGQD